MNKFMIGVAAVTGVIVGVLVIYGFMPVMAIDNPAWYAMLLPVALLLTVASFAAESRPLGLAAIGMWMVPLMVLVGSSAMFRASDHQALLGTVETSAAVLPSLSVEEPGLVSMSMAYQAGTKKLSESSDAALGSRVTLGHPVKQLVKGKLVWVMFLEHSGFFKWFSNGVTPGYVVVSASDPSEAKLVTEVNGKPLRMQYIQSAWMGASVERKVYFSGNMSKFVSDFTSEIDEFGKPYTVASIYEKQVGVSGNVVTGAVVIDAETGETRTYSKSDVPAWVDRVQDSDLVSNLVDSWASLKLGWLNSLFAGEGVLHVSSVDLVYNKGKANWYVSLTSSGADDNIAGYLLVDSVSGKAVYTRIAGVDESTAAEVMAKAIPEKKYEAANVLPYAINGEPVYVSMMTDTAGVARGFGLVHMKDFQKVVVGDTLSAAIGDLAGKMGSTGDLSGIVALPVVTKVVKRIGAEVRNGNTVYLIKFDKDTHIYEAPAQLTAELALLRAEDTVAVKYGTGSKTVPILSLTLTSN